MKIVKGLERITLVALIAIIVLGFIFLRAPLQAALRQTVPIEVEPKVLEKSLEERLDTFTQNIRSGGPPKDGIPPIDNPQYVSSEEGDKFLKDSDIVFGINYKNRVIAYPQKILVWHEIVNDEIDGEKISVTYCPLTGSTVGFKGKLDGVQLDFGTSGNLVNSNLLMYDRQSDSRWPQILGIAITGQSKGTDTVDEQFPVIWTTWEKWKAKYPDTLVLSEQTGFLRPYGTDPYGSYEKTDTYYQTGGPFFPATYTDNKFPDKKVVIGVRVGDEALAIPKEEFRQTRVANIELGGEPITAVYDSDLDAVRVFSRETNNMVLNFEIRDGKIFDEETSSEWNFDGQAVSGTLSGSVLQHVSSFDAMWFSWVSFFPETQVFQS